jgi:hypothetical protein
VQAGVCEAVVAALLRFGSEDVSTADCALYVLQSLAALDAAGAVDQLQRMSCAVNTVGRHLSCVVTVATTLNPCDTGGTGVIALLLRVLHTHYEASITVTESAVGAIGALVLQSNIMMLHLLANRGLQLLMTVMEVWGAQWGGGGGWGRRSLTAAAEIVRLCRNELRRVDSYYDGQVPGQCNVSLESAVEPEGSLFDADEMTKTVRDVAVGVPGATPAFVYKVLDAVDVCAVLMDAESGALEKDLQKQDQGRIQVKSLGSAGSVASIAMKMKSFKGGGRSDKSSGGEDSIRGPELGKGTVSNVSSSGDAGLHSQSAPTLPKLLSAVNKVATNAGDRSEYGSAGKTKSTTEPANGSVQGNSLTISSGGGDHGNSIANLKAALAKSKQHHAETTASSLVPIRHDNPAHHSTAGSSQNSAHPPAARTPLYLLCLRLLTAHGATCLSVLHPAVRLLLVLCAGDAFPHHWVMISSHGGCAALVAALRNRGLLGSEEIDGVDPVYACECAVEALLQLAQCNLETREKLRQLHAHSLVVASLQQHGLQSLRLCELGAPLFVMLYGDVSAKEAN